MKSWIVAIAIMSSPSLAWAKSPEILSNWCLDGVFKSNDPERVTELIRVVPGEVFEARIEGEHVLVTDGYFEAFTNWLLERMRRHHLDKLEEERIRIGRGERWTWVAEIALSDVLSGHAMCERAFKDVFKQKEKAAELTAYILSHRRPRLQDARAN